MEKKTEDLFEDDFTSMFDDVSGIIGEEENDEPAKGDENEDVDKADEINQTDFSDIEDPDGEDEDSPNGDDPEGEENTEGGEGSDNKDGNDSSPLVPYAKLLVEEGILPNFNIEEFDGTAESLKEAMTKEIYSGIEGYKGSLPEDVRKLIDGYEAGVPLEKLIELNKQNFSISSIKDEDLESNENVQKDIVRQYFRKTTKFTDEKIEKNIERLLDIGELEEEAKSNLADLKVIVTEEEQTSIAEAKVIQQKQQDDLKKYWETFDNKLEKLDEVVPGLKVSKSMKQRIIKNLSTPVAKDNSGNAVNKIGYYRAQNPQEFEIYLNYFFEATNGFKDFSTLGKGSKKAVIDELERAARDLDTNKNKKPVSRKTGDPDAIKGIQDYLNF